MGGLVIAVAQVRSVIPEPVHADTHAWRHKVPDVGFPQENPVGVELGHLSSTAGSNNAGASDAGVAITTNFHVNALEVSAQKNRSSGVRRPCEKSLGTPQKQIVTDQPAVTLLLTRRAATVFTSLAMSHGAQSIGSKVPNDA